MKAHTLKLILLSIISLITLTANGLIAAERQCTQAESIAAEEEISYLKNWQDVYKSFKKYHHCDDGAIAEGYSEAITSLLANTWTKIQDLKKLISKDKEFYAFVLTHIDATCDTKNLQKIIVNASDYCSSKNSKMCTAIKKAAEASLIRPPVVKRQTPPDQK